MVFSKPLKFWPVQLYLSILLLDIPIVNQKHVALYSNINYSHAKLEFVKYLDVFDLSNLFLSIALFHLSLFILRVEIIFREFM